VRTLVLGWGGEALGCRNLGTSEPSAKRSKVSRASLASAARPTLRRAQWTILGWSRINYDSKARWGQWRSVAEISEQANQAPRILSSFVPHGPAALHAMRRAAVGDFGLALIEFNSKVRPQAIN